MVQLKCPDTSRWQALLADSDANDSVELEAHLASCSRCQSVLDELAVGSSGWLRDAGRLAEKPNHDAEMTKTLHRLRDGLLDEHITPPIALDFLTPSEQPGVLGTLGRYQVLEVLGRGAFGIVLKALDPDLLRPVAIKVLAPYLAPSGTARQRFLREARAAAAVNHNHIVTIHAVEPGESLPYIVMEYVTGISLQGRLDRDGPLAPAEIARIGLQTANGLAAAHTQGLVHRDIKPANILLENGVERVKITDFGLARAADDARLTQSGVAAGTPLYMSPEQARGEAVDHRSDLFSLGSVLYTLATGFPPFRADSTMGVLNRITNNAPRPIRETIPDFPAALEKIIMQLLEKEPGKRFQLAADVSFKLTGFLSSPNEPEPPAAIENEEEPEHEAPTKWWVTALCIAAGIAVVAIVLTFKTPKGTLIVEVEDPGIKVALDGEELKITGAGPQEVRLKPGEYHVTATKDGKPAKVSQEIVTITKDGRQVVKVSIEPASGAPPASIPPPIVPGLTPPLELTFPPKIDSDKKNPATTMDPAWAAKLEDLLTRYRSLADRLTVLPAGALFITPGPIADLDKAVASIKESDREKVKKLLSWRDNFSLLIPKALQFATRLHALKDMVASSARKNVTEELDAIYSSLNTQLKEMEKLAKELGAKPELPVALDIGRPIETWETRLKKLSKEFDSLTAAITKTRTGAVLLTTPAGTDPTKATAGLNNLDATRVKRLLVIRENFAVLAPKAQKELDRWEKAGLDFSTKDANHKAGIISNGEWEQAKLELNQAQRALQTTEDAMVALLGELDKAAKELGVGAGANKDDSAAEFKKIMAEYDAFALRLAPTTVGRLLASISTNNSWSTNSIRNVVGDNQSDIKLGERLLTLRGEFWIQVAAAEGAFSAEKQNLENKGKEGPNPVLDELIQKNQQEQRFRTAAMRGIMEDLQKLADQIDPPAKKSDVPAKKGPGQ